jgi:hypothetical protein
MTLSNHTPAIIAQRIILLRGHKVIIDADLAELYGVTTKVFNQAIKRNSNRFPSDFMFRLTQEEKQEVVTNCDHLAKLKFSHSLPLAFTEHGAIQASNVLASPLAVEMGIYVVRAFVQLKELLATHRDLAAQLEALEERIEVIAYQQDSFAKNTRIQLKQVFDTLKELMPSSGTHNRPIGFITDTKKLKQSSD